MYILGISAYYHDNAAALLKDGEIVCAAQVEFSIFLNIAECGGNMLSITLRL